MHSVLPGFEDEIILRKNKAQVIAKNISIGSGGHGLKEDQIYELIKSINDDDLALFVYTLKKCAEHTGSYNFCFDDLGLNELDIDVFNFTQWYSFNDNWSEIWTIDRGEIGCYIYGYFKDAPGNQPAKVLSREVIYIGETRSITRGGMLGRRGDFKSTVKNPQVKNPYGNGSKFLEKYNKEDLKYLYQSFLPCPAHLCKQIEKKLLNMYSIEYAMLPFCNRDLER